MEIIKLPLLTFDSVHLAEEAAEYGTQTAKEWGDIADEGIGG